MLAQRRTHLAKGKGLRFNGKRAYPTVPNHTSKASGYFMFELVKTVQNWAGGSISTALITQSSSREPMHMCAFLIDQHALCPLRRICLK